MRVGECERPHDETQQSVVTFRSGTDSAEIDHVCSYLENYETSCSTGTPKTARTFFVTKILR